MKSTDPWLRYRVGAWGSRGDWTRVAISQAIKDLMRTYIEYPRRSSEHDSHGSAHHLKLSELRVGPRTAQ